VIINKNLEIFLVEIKYFKVQYYSKMSFWKKKKKLFLKDVLKWAVPNTNHFSLEFLFFCLKNIVDT